MLPELITLDDWGYPIIAEGAVPRDLVPLARATVELCPKMALRLEAIKEKVMAVEVDLAGADRFESPAA